MTRTAAAIVTALVFLAAIAVVTAAAGGWTWDGVSDRLLPFDRPAMLVAGLATLACVVLAPAIAADLTGPRAASALALGWLAALPGLFALFGLVAEATGLDAAAGCNVDVRPPLNVRCADTIAGQAIQASQRLLMLAAFTLPYSAGPLLFAIGFPAVMILRGLARLLRRPVFLAAFAVVALAAALLWLGGAAAALREPRPLDVMLTALRIETLGQNVLEIPQVMDAPSRWLQRARGEPAEHDHITRDFAARGWAMVEQLGSLRVYAKGALRYRLVCRMIGTRYQLCEAEGTP